MNEAIAELFGIIGADVVPPQTVAELIPYLMNVVVGVALVVAVFRVIARIARTFLEMRRL